MILMRVNVQMVGQDAFYGILSPSKNNILFFYIFRYFIDSLFINIYICARAHNS